MRSIEVETLRKHILKELYDKLPFCIVSGGIKLGVVISPRQYNRLKLIERIAKERREHDKKLGVFVDRVLWHSQDIPPKEWGV